MNKKVIVLCSLLSMILFGLISGTVVAATYIVQPGDNLTHIARQFGISIEAIVAANDIADPNLIIVGQVLEIPVVTESDSAQTPFIPSETLVVADFDNCTGTNNLEGVMGAAYQEPHNWLEETYVSETGQGCVARLEYQIGQWAAFWMKLQEPDLSSFREADGFLAFNVRAEEPIPTGVKIELKRYCPPAGIPVSCGELSIYYMTGISSEWETRYIPLEGFGTVGWAATLSSWENIEEMVFTFEAQNSGNNGVVYIDNIRFVR